MESKLKDRPNLTLAELSGNAYDRGYQYGIKLKGLINNFVEVFLYGDDPIGFSNLSKDQALKKGRKYAPFIEDYSPEIAEEIKGIAEGSGKIYEEIIMVNLMEERAYLSDTECTGFGVTGKATINEETYIGQNWDATIESIKMKSVFLIKEKLNHGPDILAYTYPGNVANAGFNSNGISLSWTSVPQIGNQIGVPTYVIVAEILRQKRIGDAIEAVLRAKRAGCFQFFIGDATEAYSIEATPDDVDIAYINTYLGHANHYISEKFILKQDLSKLSEKLRFKWYRSSLGCTINRCNRMNRILGDNYGNIDLETCINTLRDHVNYPYSICRHPITEENITGVTYDSWVMVPAKKEWWIARGPPCLNEYKKYII